MTGPRLGYLVPEFPGQTHVMFWRELADLRALGATVDVVSTRRPDIRLSAHPWSGEARESTTYLFPPGVRGTGSTMTGWASAGRRARRAVITTVGSARPPRRAAALAAASVLASRLADTSRRRAWDHLHVHSCAAAADVARLARAMGGSPYSLTLHGPLGDYGPDQKAKWSAAEFGIVITRRLEAELRAELGPDLPSRIAVCGMGVPPGSFDRPGAYRPWDGSGPLRVFSCGRLNPAKGHLDLLAAVRDLCGKGVPVHCVIAGEDEQGGKGYRRIVEAAVADLGLRGVVDLLGAVPEAEVRRRMHQAHVFALASIEEPLGVVLMEAMAARLPVVATRAGGVPELVTDGVDGLLVPPRDPQALAAAIGRVAADATLAGQLSAAAGEAAVRRAAAPSSARLLLDLVNGAPVATTPAATSPP